MFAALCSGSFLFDLLKETKNATVHLKLMHSILLYCFPAQPQGSQF
jgi:hypothetical protein